MLLTEEGRKAKKSDAGFAAMFFAWFLIGVALVFAAPSSVVVSPSFCWIVIGLVVVILLTMYARKQADPKPLNWLTPDVAFTGSFVVVHFLYILIWLTGVYDLGTDIWFWRGANCPHVVCKTLAMCASCLAAFHCGYCLIRPNLAIREEYQKSTIQNWQGLGKFMTRFSLGLLLAFIGLIGSAFLGGHYSGSTFSFLPSVVFLIFQGSIIASITVLVFSRASIRSKTRRIMAFDLLLVAVGAFALLLHGDRSLFLVMLVACITSISEFIKPIKLSTAVLAVIGLFILFGISQFARAGGDRSIYGFYKTGAERWGQSFEVSARTFGSSSLCAYVAVDLVPDKHNYFMGQYKTNDLAGILPFGRKIFGVEQNAETSSSHLFTLLIQGTTSKVAGAGSSVFGDLYIDFGFVGSAVAFFLLGLLFRFVTEKSRSSRSILWKVGFVALVAVSSICARYGITSLLIRHVAYPVIYTAFFAYLLGVSTKGKFKIPAFFQQPSAWR